MGRLNLFVDQGATYREVLTLKEPDGTTPRDLTGWTAHMQIRRRHSSDTTVTPTLTVDGSAGTVTVVLTDTQTADLPAGRSAYDLKLVAPSGDVENLLHGALVVAPEVVP